MDGGLRQENWWRRLLRAVPLAATLGATAWALSTNPLAAPFVDRSAGELRTVLDARVARVATSGWLEDRLSEAVAAGDAERAAMLLALADELGRDVPRAAAQALVARAEGPAAQAAACGACMIDPAACRSLAALGTCSVPFELSPLGDVNALRRAGMAWAEGEPVDRVDAGLALVGLGATAAILVTGGGSAAVKAGAGLLRTARRMGTLTPALAARLAVPVRWGAVPRFLRGRARLDEVADPRHLAVVATVARELEAVRRATSAPEALRLLRHVDGPRDAARLARVAEAAGPRTGRTLAVLGKGRVFRATTRLTRAAAGTLALLWLTALQIGVLAATRLGALLWRTALR